MNLSLEFNPSTAKKDTIPGNIMQFSQGWGILSPGNKFARSRFPIQMPSRYRRESNRC
jgi:hypothetical protein